MTVKSRKLEQSQATRAALIKTARKLFARNGYAATDIETVARRTRVTRGALYHHFKDKQDLFSAVFDLEEQKLSLIVAQAAITPIGRMGRDARRMQCVPRRMPRSRRAAHRADRRARRARMGAMARDRHPVQSAADDRRTAGGRRTGRHRARTVRFTGASADGSYHRSRHLYRSRRRQARRPPRSRRERRRNCSQAFASTNQKG